MKQTIVVFSLLLSFLFFKGESLGEEQVRIEWPKKQTEQKVSPSPQTLTIPSGTAVPGKKKTEESPLINLEGVSRPSLIIQGVALVFMALLPFLVMTLSSFVKIVVVLSLLRNALGVQQAPPNQLINSIAFLLSIYVMFPTGVKMYDASRGYIETVQSPTELFSSDSAGYFIAIADRAKEPLREFLKNNSLVKHQKSFFQTVYRMLPEKYRDSLTPQDFMVLVPSFITSQLKAAFEIGVLIYIPFFVIDLVVSNILLAMGMMMLSPVTISMPLKLFLLVMLDGWTLLIEGLVSTFR